MFILKKFDETIRENSCVCIWCGTENLTIVECGRLNSLVWVITKPLCLTVELAQSVMQACCEMHVKLEGTCPVILIIALYSHSTHAVLLCGDDV